MNFLWVEVSLPKFRVMEIIIKMDTIIDLKIINQHIADSENRWNYVSYSWHDLKKAYGIDTTVTLDLECKFPMKLSAFGLYMQQKPFEQNLLVACSQGTCFVIVVDLREDSKTYLAKNYFTLTDNRMPRRNLYIPAGCAYGFVTLEENTNLYIKTDNYVSPEFEQVFNLADPYFNIQIPLDKEGGEKHSFAELSGSNSIKISARDKYAPFYSNAMVSKEKDIALRDYEAEMV